MTAGRITAAERIKVQDRAEVEVLRYKNSHPLWHKHVHNVTLDPMQVLKCIEMDQHRNTVDKSSRRTGKTAVKEMHGLKFLATTPMQECGIVAPRLQQSQNNLSYHVDAIRRSEILSGYLGYRNGRRQLKDTGYAFANGSKCNAYGIMSQIDGDSITLADIEEVDDMPQDRLLSRFLPMLGAARRLGADPRAVKFEPSIRISGVFKGADTLQRLIDTGEYHLLPTVDVYLGMEMGIIDKAWAESMRAQQTEGEWVRQFLCRNVASQNWIWEKYVRRALAVGLEAGIEIAGPLPGVRYKKKGLIAFGYDHTGHGENPSASKSSLVVTEQMGSWVTFPFVKTWPAGTDDRVIARDLVGLWAYFNPDFALGDAYGVGMLTEVNDKLYADGLTDVDRRTIGNGESTATTWKEWPFSPVRFDGMAKHSMASALRSAFHSCQAAIPYFEDVPGFEDWTAFVRQLVNIREEETKSSYASFKMVDPKFGDDSFDAAMASVWALVTQGVAEPPTVVMRRLQERQTLLGLQLKPAVLEAA